MGPLAAPARRPGGRATSRSRPRGPRPPGTRQGAAPRVCSATRRAVRSVKPIMARRSSVAASGWRPSSASAAGDSSSNRSPSSALARSSTSRLARCRSGHVTREGERLVHVRKGERMVQGALLGLEVVEVGQLLEVGAQVAGVERRQEPLPSERLRLAVPPECFQHVDVGPSSHSMGGPLALPGPDDLQRRPCLLRANRRPAGAVRSSRPTPGIPARPACRTAR